MKLKLKCPGCGAVYRLTERPVVDHVRCPTCKTRFPVDAPSMDAPVRTSASDLEQADFRPVRSNSGDVANWLLFVLALICLGFGIACSG